MKTPTAPAPIAIPVDTLKNAARLTRSLVKDNSRPWYWQTAIPANGIPIQFNGGGTVRAGIKGWIIDGHARTVFLGEALSETQIGEFVILTDGGSQVLAQVGRDFDFINTR